MTWDEAPPLNSMTMTSRSRQREPQPEQAYHGGGIFAGPTFGPAEQQAEREVTEIPFDLPEDQPSTLGPNVANPSAYFPVQHPVQHGMPQQVNGLGQIKGEPAHALGLSVVGTALGAYLGAKFGGGIYGGLAGAALAGSGINALRALLYLKEGTPEADHEAKISGVYAIGAATIGGYIWAKMVGPTKKE